MIIGEDGQVLYADSSISYDQLLEEYKNGRRTPLEAFSEISKEELIKREIPKSLQNYVYIYKGEVFPSQKLPKELEKEWKKYIKKEISE